MPSCRRAGAGEGEAEAPEGWVPLPGSRRQRAETRLAAASMRASSASMPAHLHCSPCCPASAFTFTQTSPPSAGKTISHIKQVPGWSEKLASDAEAVVKAEHVSPQPSRMALQGRCAQPGNRAGRDAVAGWHASWGSLPGPPGSACAVSMRAEAHSLHFARLRTEPVPPPPAAAAVHRLQRGGDAAADDPDPEGSFLMEGRPSTYPHPTTAMPGLAGCKA